MIKPQSIYMWVNVYNTIQIIDSQIDLSSKTIDLYYLQYSQYKQHSIIGPSVFLYQISNKNITVIHQTKYIP